MMRGSNHGGLVAEATRYFGIWKTDEAGLIGGESERERRETRLWGV